MLFFILATIFVCMSALFVLFLLPRLAADEFVVEFTSDQFHEMKARVMFSISKNEEVLEHINLSPLLMRYCQSHRIKKTSDLVIPRHISVIMSFIKDAYEGENLELKFNSMDGAHSCLISLREMLMMDSDSEGVFALDILIAKVKVDMYALAKELCEFLLSNVRLHNGRSESIFSKMITKVQRYAKDNDLHGDLFADLLKKIESMKTAA